MASGRAKQNCRCIARGDHQRSESLCHEQSERELHLKSTPTTNSAESSAATTDAATEMNS